MVWQYIGIGSTALAVILLLLLLWRRREIRRTKALVVAAMMAEMGLNRIMVPILHAYVIGNYIGKDSIGRVIREVIEEVARDGPVPLLRECGWKMVEGTFLKNPADRSRLETLLGGATEKKSE